MSFTTSDLHAEVQAYLSRLSSADSAWPVDVQQLYEALHAVLFDPAYNLTQIKDSAGLRDHNVSSRFKLHVGTCPKKYRLDHQMRVAARLLLGEQYDGLCVGRVAFLCGYDQSHSFSMAFKRHYGMTPTEYRFRNTRRNN